MDDATAAPSSDLQRRLLRWPRRLQWRLWRLQPERPEAVRCTPSLDSPPSSPSTVPLHVTLLLSHDAKVVASQSGAGARPGINGRNSTQVNSGDALARQVESQRIFSLRESADNVASGNTEVCDGHSRSSGAALGTARESGCAPHETPWRGC